MAFDAASDQTIKIIVPYNGSEFKNEVNEQLLLRERTHHEHSALYTS